MKNNNNKNNLSKFLLSLVKRERRETKIIKLRSSLKKKINLKCRERERERERGWDTWTNQKSWRFQVKTFFFLFIVFFYNTLRYLFWVVVVVFGVLFENEFLLSFFFYKISNNKMRVEKSKIFLFLQLKFIFKNILWNAFSLSLSLWKKRK